MDTLLHGNVWKFGDNINTDIISPPQYMELSIAEAAPYCMSAVNPDFAAQVRPGDILVAGNNLGSGSSRETSPLTLRYLEIQAVVACSFARIFYRNCINLGIPALSAPRADEIRQGDALSIDIAQGIIHNITQQEIYPCTRLPDNIMAMIRAGGLVNHLRQTGGCDAN
ncbi:3-isopropylmalate dehydratase [Edwardsiella ictaluri]|uniref:LeuD/DmdB family oxidoreductase small subunit n=1 Tax=Edwardsiella ictaluri TaxID=67780 RepID=UPI0009BFB64B|nr:3-isopropylmalate dehydratase [Edwardsiella ictaluri]ARD38565.1 3-isopropylmalate dehydratase [Edwardsiella ictaluri]QPW26988.1 3-isopropylmalate dehydratase [Edwardsiella ictaluri]